MLKHVFSFLLILSTLFTYNTGYAQFARVQAMWASPDPALEEVDIYVSVGGGVIHLLQNIESAGDASQFISGPANVEYDIGIAPGNSVSVNDTIKNYSATLANNSLNILVGTGVQNPNLYVPNPNGKDISVNGYLNTNAREFSTNPANVDLGFFHGSTDLPAIDITIDGTTLLADNIAYGEFDNYVSVSPGMHTFEVKNASTGDLICVYQGNFSNTNGWAAMVFIAGFLDPQANQSGVPLLMGAVLAPSASGILFQKIPTGISTEKPRVPDNFELSQNYPNPFNPSTTIHYGLKEATHVNIKVYNIAGQKVNTLVDGFQTAGYKSVIWNGKDSAGQPVASGIYIYRMQTIPSANFGQGFVKSNKMFLTK